MDPWLEHPTLWPDVHNGLIAGIRDVLSPRVAPRYVVRLEQRVYVAESWGLELLGRPDAVVAERTGRVSESGAGQERGGVAVEVLVADEVRETYVEVRVAHDEEVVTVIEVLSPTNKLRGRGRRAYEKKRMRVLASPAHLVEIDLVRTGKPMPPVRGPGPSDCRILVSRGDRRPTATLYPFSVRDPIPVFTVPLRRGDAEPSLDVGAVLRDLYSRARYDLSIDCRTGPTVALPGGDRDWAAALLRDRSAEP
jgi:hypothetical protein